MVPVAMEDRITFHELTNSEGSGAGEVSHPSGETFANELFHRLESSPELPKGVITWSDLLQSEAKKPYFRDILRRIEDDRRSGIVVYPRKEQTFEAFKVTTLESLKVVILGQDPYHGPNQAHGLCFSVKQPEPPPPSLQNIFQELKRDLGVIKPGGGDLSSWAKQGVFLLNTTLSVRANTPASHSTIGWERFTDFVISKINENKEGVVFLLWGAHAKRKASLINTSRHFVLSAPHPSPLSAYRGFIGCGHFSKCNELLAQQGKDPIRWGE
jgi:uracil-DNA glycosylase